MLNTKSVYEITSLSYGARIFTVAWLLECVLFRIVQTAMLNTESVYDITGLSYGTRIFTAA